MNYTEIEAIKDKLKAALPEKTYLHSLRTVCMAMELSLGSTADRDVVFLASLLHDCAKKRMPDERHLAELRDFIGYDSVIHAPLGAMIAKEEYGIRDARVLDAIRYHTTGKAKMTIEEKIVFLADAIEDGRDYPEVAYIREQTKCSLDNGVLASLKSTVNFVESKGNAVHPLTIEAMDYLKNEREMI